MAEPTDPTLQQMEKLMAETSAVAALAVQLASKLEVSGLAQFVGLLSAASGIATEWLKSVTDPAMKRRLADALVLRLMGAADLIQMAGDGTDPASLVQKDV